MSEFLDAWAYQSLVAIQNAARDAQIYGTGFFIINDAGACSLSAAQVFSPSLFEPEKTSQAGRPWMDVQ